MRRVAAANPLALVSSTAAVLRKLRVDAIAILSEAKSQVAPGQNMACISNVEGDFSVLSSDKIQDRLAKNLDLLYTQTEMWNRSLGNIEQNTVWDKTLPVIAQRLTGIQQQLSEIGRIGLDTQPGFFCVDTELVENLVDLVYRTETFCGRIKSKFAAATANFGKNTRKLDEVTMQALIYKGARYVLHTATTSTPKPEDWEENKQEYIDMVVQDLETLEQTIIELEAEYMTAESTDPVGRSIPRLDSLQRLVSATVDVVRKGNYTFTMPGYAPTIGATTTILDCVGDYTKLLNSWKALADKIKGKKSILRVEEQIEEEEPGMPKYVETFLAAVKSGFGDVYTMLAANDAATAVDAKAALAASPRWEPLSRALAPEAFVAFNNFLKEVKMVSDALASGKNTIKRVPKDWGKEDKEKNPEYDIYIKRDKAFGEEWPVQLVVKDLQKEYRNYRLLLAKQRQLDKEAKKQETKVSKEPKQPKEKEPVDIIALAKELSDILADIKNKANLGKIDLLNDPVARKAFLKLQEDVIKAAEAAEKGEKTVELSTGVEGTTEAIKRLKDATKVYSRLTKKGLEPEAKEEEKVEGKLSFIDSLNAQIAALTAQIAELRTRQTDVAVQKSELIKNIKKIPDRAERQRRVRGLEIEERKLAAQIAQKQDERAKLVLRRDETEKALKPTNVQPGAPVPPNPMLQALEEEPAAKIDYRVQQPPPSKPRTEPVKPLDWAPWWK